MAFFLRKSLSEDHVDHCSRTWAFLFLLLLSLITLLLPLSPSLNMRVFSHSERVISMGNSKGYPTFKSSCWVPVEFTLAMSNYAHKVCSSAYNSIVQGRNSSTASLIIRNEDPIPLQPRDGGYGERKLFVSEKSTKAREERDEVARKTRELLMYIVPFYLSTLAFFLILPYAVWSLLAMCCGCVNVDQTLTTAQSVQSLDSDGQQRVYEEIAVVLGSLKKKTTGLLYLLMKVLVIVVAFLGQSAARGDFLRFSERFENQLNADKANEDTGMAFLSRHSGNQMNLSVENLEKFPEVMFCSFEIAQLQNIQSFFVQCLFTPEDVFHADESGPGARDDDTSAFMSQEQIFLMYNALFTIVFTIFIILLIFNCGSLLIWCAILFLPCYRSKMGLNTEASVDLVFLIAMAKQNTSGLVVAELLKRSAPRRSDTKAEVEGKLIT